MKNIPAAGERPEAEAMGFPAFASAVFSYVRQTQFHRTYYRVLEHFVRGDIRKLIITVPP